MDRIALSPDGLNRLAAAFIEYHPENRISSEQAISPQSEGLKIYEAPLFAFGDPGDPLFEAFKKPEAIGPHFKAPRQWLSEAETVIAFFLPFTEEVREANRRDLSWPAEQWLHARIEGQALLAKLMVYLRDELVERGYPTLAPAIEKGFETRTGLPSGERTRNGDVFTSNWSERHVAFAGGLGTFGLSKGLITARGVAGRFGSLVTALRLPPTPRTYQDLYEYCANCGICAKNCPAGAITLEKGKDHPLCSRFLDQVFQKHHPRYGCGKCQVKTPCESRRPESKPAP